MRKILLALLLAMGLTGALSAQGIEIIQGPLGTKVRMSTLTATGAGTWVDVSQYGAYDHVFSYNVSGGTVGSISISLQCSTDGTNIASTIVTLTGTGAMTGTQGSGTGGCGYVRPFITSLSGTNAIITPTWVGSPASTAGTTVVSVANTSTTQTAYSAAAATTIAGTGSIYGLLVNAGANTDGTIVWVNFFESAPAGVTPGTTPALFSVPVATVAASPIQNTTVVPFGQPIGIPYAAGLSANCTTSKNGATGTKAPCNILLGYRRQ